MTSYEIVVIGSGPAGHHAAIQAAKLGRSVAIIERLRVRGRRLHQHGHHPVEDAARGRALPLGLPAARALRPLLSRQADHHHPGPHVPMPSRDRQGERRLPRASSPATAWTCSRAMPPSSTRTPSRSRATGPPPSIRAERVVIATGTVPATSHDVPDRRIGHHRRRRHLRSQERARHHDRGRGRRDRHGVRLHVRRPSAPS